jgi:hypothetical protein
MWNEHPSNTASGDDDKTISYEFGTVNLVEGAPIFKVVKDEEAVKR